MTEYKNTLREITRSSNELLLQVVEDLSYLYSDNAPNKWSRAEVEAQREQVLVRLLAERDAFVFGNQDVLMSALGFDEEELEEPEVETMVAGV